VMGWVFVSSAKEGQGLSPSLTPADINFRLSFEILRS